MLQCYATHQKVEILSNLLWEQFCFEGQQQSALSVIGKVLQWYAVECARCAGNREISANGTTFRISAPDGNACWRCKQFKVNRRSVLRCLQRCAHFELLEVAHFFLRVGSLRCAG